MSKEKNIVFIHLLNDFSGSPRILSQVIKDAVNKGYNVDVFTCNNDGDGFLSKIAGTNQYFFFYKWSPIKLITLILFLFSQLVLFIKLLRYRKTNTIFYINTILPFGAALAGKLLNKKIIYHVHETSIKPALFKKFLFYIAQKSATEAIYVSNFLLNQEKLETVNCHVVYNAISDDFIIKSNKHKPKLDTFTVLMLSSLKEYKGVHEFIELAHSLLHINFELVINSSQKEIDIFFKDTSLPKNITLFPSQRNVHPFYERANLVLNLSHPLKWVETFGMTALEAMCYSIPVIVPPVGGIAELVEDGKWGYKIDVRNMEELSSRVLFIYENQTEYWDLSKNAKTKSTEFDPQMMTNQIFSIIKFDSL